MINFNFVFKVSFTFGVHINSASLENSVNIRNEAVGRRVNTHISHLHTCQDVEDLLIVVDVIEIIASWERDVLTGQPEHIVLVQSELHHGVVEAEDEDGETAVEDVASQSGPQSVPLHV